MTNVSTNSASSSNFLPTNYEAIHQGKVNAMLMRILGDKINRNIPVIYRINVEINNQGIDNSAFFVSLSSYVKNNNFLNNGCARIFS